MKSKLFLGWIEKKTERTYNKDRSSIESRKKVCIPSAKFSIKILWFYPFATIRYSQRLFRTSLYKGTATTEEKSLHNCL